MNTQSLSIGIDGGATKTVAVLADAHRELSRGLAGPSNIQAVGEEVGLKALEISIADAFAKAGLQQSTVRGICLGLAGIDRDGVDVIERWCARQRIAEKISIANDATLLFAAGTADGWGLAIVAGTGSIAFVRTADGEIGRCGGWGWLLGDEGSAYNFARRALRAACRAFDRSGPATALVDRLIREMKLQDAPEFIPAVYRLGWDKAAIAGLAPAIFDVARQGDSVARALVEQEAEALASTAASAVLASRLPRSKLPIAVTGGMITENEDFREMFLSGLRAAGIEPGIVQKVTEPVLGAVRIARELA